MNKRILQVSYFSFMTVGILYLGGSLRLPMGTIEAPRSGLFPLLVAIFVTAISFTLLVRSLKKEKFPLESLERFPGGADRNRVVAVALSLILFSVGLRFLGYLICTIGLMAIVVRLLGMRNWAQVVLTAILTGLVSYGLFVFLLGVPLPRGEVFP